MGIQARGWGLGAPAVCTENACSLSIWRRSVGNVHGGEQRRAMVTVGL